MLAPTSNALRLARLACGSRARRRMLAVVGLIRVLVILLALNLSGVAHRIADVLFHDDAGEPSRDDDDSDCSPGCPTCHSCAHAQVPYVPRAAHVESAPIAVASKRTTGRTPKTSARRSSGRPASCRSPRDKPALSPRRLAPAVCDRQGRRSFSQAKGIRMRRTFSAVLGGLSLLGAAHFARAGETTLAEPLIQENITDIDALEVGSLEFDLTPAYLRAQHSSAGLWTTGLEAEWRPIDRLGVGAEVDLAGALDGSTFVPPAHVVPRASLSYVFLRDFERSVFLQAELGGRYDGSSDLALIDPTEMVLPYRVRGATVLGPIDTRVSVLGEAGDRSYTRHSTRASPRSTPSRGRRARRSGSRPSPIGRALTPFSSCPKLSYSPTSSGARCAFRSLFLSRSAREGRTPRTASTSASSWSPWNDADDGSLQARLQLELFTIGAERFQEARPAERASHRCVARDLGGNEREGLVLIGATRGRP